MSKVVLASQLPNKRNASLAPGLKQRHVTMLSIAGVIGAGLFVAPAMPSPPPARPPCSPT